MVEFGTAIEIDGEQIVPVQVDNMSLQVPHSDIEALAEGMVGTCINDAIIASPTREGCFSISLHAIGLSRIVVTRQELDVVIHHCRVIVNVD